MSKAPAKFCCQPDVNWAVFTTVLAGLRQSERDYRYGRRVFQYGPGSGYVHDIDLPISDATGDVVCWDGDYSHYPCFISFGAEAILQQTADQNLVLQCDPKPSTTARRTSSARAANPCRVPPKPSPAGAATTAPNGACGSAATSPKKCWPTTWKPASRPR